MPDGNRDIAILFLQLAASGQVREDIQNLSVPVSDITTHFSRDPQRA